jgi:hypothetical protein
MRGIGKRYGASGDLIDTWPLAELPITLLVRDWLLAAYVHVGRKKRRQWLAAGDVYHA